MIMKLNSWCLETSSGSGSITVFPKQLPASMKTFNTKPVPGEDVVLPRWMSCRFFPSWQWFGIAPTHFKQPQCFKSSSNNNIKNNHENKSNENKENNKQQTTTRQTCFLILRENYYRDISGVSKHCGKCVATKALEECFCHFGFFSNSYGSRAAKGFYHFQP